VAQKMGMTILSQNNFNQSNPFDIIRRIDENGMEYWSARELMPLLGYKRWHKFLAVIETAKENLETLDLSASHHITPTGNLVKRPQGGGSTQLDYHLSRLACYHVALCCDSRGNDQVKQAKHYFAVKTREAEVLIPAQQNELEVLRLKLELAQAERDAAIAQTKLLETRKMITEMANPTVSALILGATVVTEPVTVERVIDRDRTYEGIGITTVAQKLGFGKNTKACWQWLDSIGYGKDSGHWELQLSAVENHKLKPSAFNAILQKYRNSDRQKWLGE
jgi:DNA-damage-inducible protein D